jgi:hypothetical membrane protein
MSPPGPLLSKGRTVIRRMTVVVTGGVRPTILPMVALAGFLSFVAVVLSEPVLHPRYSLLLHPISDFAIGRYGYVQTAGLFALGVALLTLDVSLWRSLTLTRWSRAGLVAITLCGFASLGTGIWPADVAGSVVETTSGVVHAVAADVGYCSLTAAMVLLSLHFRRDRPWRRLFVPSLVLAVLGVLALVVVAWTAETSIRGLSQRIMAVPLLLWLLVTSTRAHAVLVAKAGTGRLRSRSHRPA